MNWQSLVLALATFAFLLVVNLTCDPGIGDRRPPQPRGFELERYFGWPAWYRVELWESDDPGLMDRGTMAFRWYDPAHEMTLKERNVGWLAIVVDSLFAILAAVAVGTLAEGSVRGRLERRGTALLILSACALLGLYFLADVVEVYL